MQYTLYLQMCALKSVPSHKLSQQRKTWLPNKEYTGDTTMTGAATY